MIALMIITIMSMSILLLIKDVRAYRVEGVVICYVGSGLYKYLAGP